MFPLPFSLLLDDFKFKVPNTIATMMSIIAKTRDKSSKEIIFYFLFNIIPFASFLSIVYPSRKDLIAPKPPAAIATEMATHVALMPNTVVATVAAVADPVKDMTPPVPAAGAVVAVATGVARYSPTAAATDVPATAQAIFPVALIRMILFLKSPSI